MESGRRLDPREDPTTCPPRDFWADPGERFRANFAGLLVLYGPLLAA